MDKKQQFIEKCLKKILTSKFIIALALELPAEVYDDFIKEIAKVIHFQLSECWDMAGEEKTIELCDCACHSFYWPKTRRNKNHGCCRFEYKNRVKNSLTSQKEEKENLISLKDMIDKKECENCGTDTEQHTCVDCEQDIPSYICEKYKGICPHCSWLIGK